MVVATLMVFECAMRMAGDLLSTDLRHIREIPRWADELARADGTRVLFLGNSLTREGFDPETFARAMEENSTTRIEARSVSPDDTTIVEWPALFRHYFVNTEQVPDVLVVGFARDHLSDATRVHPSRLARFYSGLSDIPRIFRYDVLDFGGRSEYLLAYTSSAFGNRRRVSRRFFDLWVPHFREARREINRAPEGGAGNPAPGLIHSYERLERFARLLRVHDVRSIFVAMPIATAYALDPSLREALDSQGIELIDARDIPGISKASFRDRVHLNPSGALIYSEWLARQLAAHLAR